MNVENAEFHGTAQKKSFVCSVLEFWVRRTSASDPLKLDSPIQHASHRRCTGSIVLRYNNRMTMTNENEIPKQYDPAAAQEKWSKYWEENNLFTPQTGGLTPPRSCAAPLLRSTALTLHRQHDHIDPKKPNNRKDADDFFSFFFISICLIVFYTTY